MVQVCDHAGIKMTIPLEIRGLYFSYEEKGSRIIDGIDLAAEKGGIISVLGLSGCGKSTLCYCMCGIIPHIYEGILSGEVLIFGKPASRMKLPLIFTRVGIVFQDPDTQLFSPTVEDEIAFGPENLCLDRSQIGQRIDECLKITGMSRYRLAHPEKLSGGQKQLIAIASVLALEPEIIIFDESLSQVDSEGKARIKDTILELRDRGKTIIMVEHDLDNLDIADRAFFMGEGRLKEIDKNRAGDAVDLFRGR
jgi:energy-coupling factor transport system ATP-binding protein